MPLADDLGELHAIAASLRVHAERLADSGATGLPAASAELIAERAAVVGPEAPVPAQVPETRPLARPQPAAPAASAKVSSVQAVVATAAPAASPVAPAPSAAPLDLEARNARLRVLESEVKGCTRCALHAGRTQTVFARGNGTSGLCFVGEGPGADEDAQGFPFVGKAGQLLDRMIAAMGFERDDVYVANIVKCLRYDTQVQLENGAWERIGRLVAQRYGGRVMSVDESGQLVTKRVIGWHASPLGERRVYRLTYASSALRGGNRATTKLTEDHPVLTSRGWVNASDLTSEDMVAVGQGLSQVAYETIVGTLLGDGTISKLSSFLEVIHKRDHREYVELKARALRELRPIVSDSESSDQNGRTHLTTRCRTLATRAMRILRRTWYPDGKKRLPADLKLTPRVVAIWFLDDGYTKIKSEYCGLSEIAAHCFSAEERARLVSLLHRDLGLNAYERTSSPGRIHFGADDSLKLARIIAPFCPPTMRYKLHRQAAALFDESAFEPDVPRTLYDRVIVERLENHGTDRTFFCIDVEDTHNFVTSGGVVHNCRPPNNRKPEIDEMAACMPYLAEQLELIDPQVIVALGATAVQGLLGTSEGITRIRGRWRLYKGRIAVMPTFHPAYLLRTPGAKREVWEDLQAVLRQMGRPIPARR